MEKIKDKVWVKIINLMQASCIGCKEDLANQQGHICIMNSQEDNLLQFFDQAWQKVLDNDGIIDILRKEVEISMLADLQGWDQNSARAYCDISNTKSKALEVSSDEEVKEVESDQIVMISDTEKAEKGKE